MAPVSAVAILLAGVAAALAQPASSSPPTVHEAEVAGQPAREARQRQLETFVKRVPALNNGAFARWVEPMCPVVTGMTEQQGEYVLLRLFQAAKAAGAPAIESGKCETNVYIVATADPAGFIKALAKRAPRIFEAASADEVRRFEQTPRPVRTWYTAKTTQQTTGTNAPFEGGGADGLDALPGNTGVNHHADDTRLHANTSYGLTSAVVVIDSKRLAGMKMGALADYIAMAALIQLQTDADVGDAPSVLSLFSPPAGSAAPEGLTPWDTAFLDALYHTNLEDFHQNTTIAMHMDGALAHPDAAH
jgi:hypothetical protein